MKQCRRSKYRLLILSACVCGLLAFSTTLSASSTVFTLGNSIPNSSFYQVKLSDGTTNDGNAIPAGPYPGTLTGSPIMLFFCLNGILDASWDTSYSGNAASPSGQQQDEAAFLASLFLTDAAASGIALNTYIDTGGKATLNETGPTQAALASFIDTVQGPITMAIWQVMGSLPSGSPYNVTQNDPKAQSFVTLAQASYGAFATSMNPYDVVFVPGSGSPGIQSFIGVSVASPEPGTMVLFGTGVLLMALGCTGRLKRRPR